MAQPTKNDHDLLVEVHTIVCEMHKRMEDFITRRECALTMGDWKTQFASREETRRIRDQIFPLRLAVFGTISVVGTVVIGYLLQHVLVR